MTRAVGHLSRPRGMTVVAVAVPLLLVLGLLGAFALGDQVVERVHQSHVVQTAEVLVHARLIDAVAAGEVLDLSSAPPGTVEVLAVEARTADGQRATATAMPSMVSPSPAILRELLLDPTPRLMDLPPVDEGGVDRALPRSVLVPVADVGDLGTVLFQVDHDAQALAAAVRQDARDARQVTLGLAILALIALAGGWVAVGAGYRSVARQQALAARRDDLTGLPNRRALHQHMSRLVEDGTPFSVIAADLTRLKEINDTLGHEAGDLLIVEAASRLRIAAHGVGEVHRLGGDEFTVLVPHGTAAESDAVLRRITRAFTEPFTLLDLRVDVGVSLGVALHPDDGATTSDLLRRADSAMYAAKREGVPSRSFTRDLDRIHEDRVNLGNALRQAIELGQIQVHYQPQVAADDRRPVRVEALARWSHEGIDMSPSRFIPLVEDLGLGHLLTERVLDDVLAQMARWSADGLEVLTAVNIFPGDIIDRALPERVERLLQRHGVPASQLALEVTERAAVVQTVRAAEVMRDLRTLGVGLAIDDFGTGAWSLSHLQGLPVDCLKLDRSMVIALPDDDVATAMVESVTGLAHRLGMHVVAEGIETDLQSACVRAMGVDVLQGHAFHRAMAAEAVTEVFTADAGVGTRRAG